jgi:hypothetical protein
MKIKWRKWNRVIHRDLSYFFTGMTIIYAISGIALNHIQDWNPSYDIQIKEFTLDRSYTVQELDETTVIQILEDNGEKESYKKHYFPNQEQLKVFISGGSVYVNLKSGKGMIEKLKRRPILFQFNFLHYNPTRWWTWFSDIFCVALIFITITGLLIIKGKNGISGRGWWMTALGLIIPIVALILLL